MKRITGKLMRNGGGRAFVYVALILLLTGALVPGALPVGSGVALANGASTTLLPSSQSIPVGATTTVDIMINNVANLYGAEVHIGFDHTKIEVVDANLDVSGIQIQLGNFLASLVPSDLAFIAQNGAYNVAEPDHPAGTIDFTFTFLNPQQPFSGSFTLATITFHCIAAGTANINITSSNLAGVINFGSTDPNNPPDIVSITHAKEGATITNVLDVPLSLLPGTNNVKVGETFNVTINTNCPAGQSVSGVAAYVNFDHNYLEVVDADGVTGGVQIQPGTALPTLIENTVDNAAGHIGYSAGKLTTPPSGSFLVATITFRAKAETPEGCTPITISLTSPRQSLVAYLGNAVPGTHVDSQACIVFDVPLSLLPATNDKKVGEIFTVTINTNLAAGQQASAVDAFVDFDPNKLEVVDANAEEEGVQIQPGTALNNVLGNRAYNVDTVVGGVLHNAGTIDFSAGKLTNPPSGSFLVATITFRAKGETPEGECAPITISLAGERKSLVAYAGNAVPGTHTDSQACIVFDVPLSLLPASIESFGGQQFTVTINTNCPAGQSVAAVDAFVNFDSTYLEVVDANAEEEGAQIQPGTALNNVLGNRAYNVDTVVGGVLHNAGTIDFSAGKLTNPPSGSFLVATITFQAKIPTQGAGEPCNPTPVTISLTGERKSLVAYLGNAVPGTHADSSVCIKACLPVNITVTLQGGSRPAAGRVVPVDVRLHNTGLSKTDVWTQIKNNTALDKHSGNSADTGSNTVSFQVCLLPGTYDISIFTTHALANLKRNVVVSSAMTLSLGTLLEGNCNDDNIINALDFSILAASYLKLPGAGFDARADFDINNAVNALDFSLLAANYLKGAPQELTP